MRKLIVTALAVCSLAAVSPALAQDDDDGSGQGAGTPICEPIRDPFTGRWEIVCR